MLRTLLLATALLAAPLALPGQAGPVRGVLFFSPSCPHCHVVMNESLPPLQARYGGRLVIATVDVSTPRGQAMYRATVRDLGIPPSRVGVPTLVVGGEVLVGSGEIPAILPGLIEDGLARGGVAWPAVAELQEALRDRGRAAPAEPEAEVAPGALVPLIPSDATPAASPAARFLLDPMGNAMAVAALLLLLAALAWAALRVRAGGLPETLPSSPLVPALLFAGLFVAVYLSFVEVTGTEAVCGPVGDCNTVQQSAWARLFGVIPVGVLGMVGYGAMGWAWLAARRARLAHTRKGAARLFWLMAFVGTAFSAWLTFLEPFVIGATCVWCVTSALLMAALLLTATERVELREGGRRARRA